MISRSPIQRVFARVPFRPAFARSFWARVAPACAALLACAVLAVAPARAQNNGNIFENIFKPPGQASPEQERLARENSELVMRLERMENALRQLTGQVEQLQYKTQQLESQLRRPEDGRAGAAPVAVPPPAVATMPARPAEGAPVGAPASGGKRSDAFDPNAEPAAPGAPKPLGSPASASPGPAPSEGGTQVAAVPGAAGASGARELYDAGQAKMQQQDYGGAEQSFRQIVKSHPSDRLVPEATFMMGESLFLRKNYSDAAAAFLDVSTKYPNFTRAPEALLRLGQSLAGLGERDTACRTFAEVDRKYPRASSAVRQAVEREQKRSGC